MRLFYTLRSIPISALRSEMRRSAQTLDLSVMVLSMGGIADKRLLQIC